MLDLMASEDKGEPPSCCYLHMVSNLCSISLFFKNAVFTKQFCSCVMMTKLMTLYFLSIDKGESRPCVILYYCNIIFVLLNNSLRNILSSC